MEKYKKDPIINLAAIDEAGDTYQFDQNNTAFKKQISTFVGKKDFQVDLEIHAVKPHFALKGSVKTKCKLACTFCTEDFLLDINETFQDILAPQWAEKMKTSTSPKDFFEAEVELVTGLEGNEFHLIDYTNEIIGFAIPSHPRCSPDCKGLCVECGINLNRKSCDCSKNKHSGHIGFSALKNIKIDSKH